MAADRGDSPADGERPRARSAERRSGVRAGTNRVILERIDARLARIEAALAGTRAEPEEREAEPEIEVTDVDRAAARAVARRWGLVVKEPKR